MFRALTIVFLVALLNGFLHAQPQAATLTFTLDFPGSQPDHYLLRVDSDGKGQYESQSKLSNESDDEDSFKYDFKVSPATTQQMFALAARAGYFRKDLDAHRRNMAFTGNKTLA